MKRNGKAAGKRPRSLRTMVLMNGYGKDLPWDAKILDAAASEILKEAPIERWVSRDGKRCCLWKKTFRLAYMTHIGAIVPLRGNPEATKPAKLISDGNKCRGCGVPRANGSANVCRKCYLNEAKEKKDAEVKAATSYLAENTTMIDFWQCMAESTRFEGPQKRVVIHYDEYEQD